MTDYTPTIYLAGPVQHADDGGHDWRNDVVEQYGDQFDFLNPLDKYDTPSTEVEWLQPDEVPSDYPDDVEVLSPAEIVQADKGMISSCDVLLIGLRSAVPMYGTPREHEYATAALDKRVVVWHTEDMVLSPWTITGTDYLSTDLHDCMEHIATNEIKDSVREDVIETLAESL